MIRRFREQLILAIKSNRKQTRNFLIYLFTDGLSQALPFLVLPFIAEELGAEDFGVVANLTVLVQLYLAIMGMRLAFYYSADYYQVTEEEKRKLVFNSFAFYLSIGIIMVLLTLAVSPYLAEAFMVPALWHYLALFMVFNQLLGQLLTTHLRMAEQANWFGIIQFCRAVLSAGFSVLLVLVLDWGWEGRGWAMLVSSLFLGGAAIFFFGKQGILAQPYDWQLQKKLLWFGLPMLPYALSPWLKNGIEKLLITQEVSLAANGVYSLALSLGSVFGIITSSFFATYTPMVYKTLSNQKDIVKGKQQLVKQGYLVALGFLLVLVVGYIAIRLLILSFFSIEYAEAIVFLPLILATVWLGIFLNLFKVLVIYTKKTKLLGITGLAISLVQVPITYYSILYFDTIGAPIAGLLGSVFMVIVYFLISQRYVKMPWLFFLIKA